ncbi:hypothetical protein EW026_g6403 [Hermanssonia centrifuga]|uniref:Uncharacterized protein n=1 Tax=Hermanssonia centrifuga TaxID=98765 RepID=A0A4V3X9R4_9APHY|nr:hypothetical protein EW026_g6403 [Hermanssonia centrifuga]
MDSDILPTGMQNEATVFETEPNDFGVYRRYHRKPCQDISEEGTDDSLCDTPTIATTSPFNPSSALDSFGRAVVNGLAKAPDWFTPFLNSTVFRLMHWAYTGSNQKSTGEIERLVHDVLLSPDFDREHLEGFRMGREERRLDEHATSTNANFNIDDGWHEASINIPLPKERTRHDSEEQAPHLEVKGVWHRKLLDVIITAYREKSVRQLVFTPYQFLFQEADESPERVYTEGYTCDALLEEDANIQAQPRHVDDNQDVEYSMVPLMLWSDSTHLANFGTASLWPIYLYFGNLSKYLRCKPSHFAAHHLAYIPSLPDTIQDVYQNIYGLPATKNVLRFCKTQIMHAVWLLLMDEQFMEAYVHGILVDCGDNIRRRLFPRFFTYSADYPERILLACIRFLGRCPCPNCLVLKSRVPDMGTKYDRKRQSENGRKDTTFVQMLIAKARKLIFQFGKSITSKAVECKIQPTSLLPTRSAFSIRLASLGFNHYSLYVYDLLHEFELGVWKANFTHILRVLYAEGGDRIQALNRRFRQVPTFGRYTIRRFSNNVSGMKKLAARDFEDILQCILPCIEGLLPSPLEKIVLDLLWDLAVWHALAKLRLHTDTSLSILDQATTNVGTSVRRFARACANIDTRELPREEAARGRREVAKGKVVAGKKQKKLNLQTFKWHDMGHVVSMIRKCGTTDGYSTQVGECEHKRVKKMYARTNKREHEGQIATKGHREGLLVKIKEKEKDLKPCDSQQSMHPGDVPPPIHGLPSQPKKKEGKT